MEKTSIYADNYGIHILQPNGRYYPVAWWQIEKEGIDSWIDHLKEKSWFTDELSQEFEELYSEKIDSCHFR